MPRVLVIDDDLMVARLLEDHLTEEGLEVVCVHMAEQGFTLATQNPPDLIMLDVNLPDATGFQMCGRLRSHPSTKTVPIIMMTGAARFPNQQKIGRELGANEYIIKPFDVLQVGEKVYQLLGLKKGEKPTPASAKAAEGPTPVESKPSAASTENGSVVPLTLVSPSVSHDPMFQAPDTGVIALGAPGFTNNGSASHAEEQPVAKRPSFAEALRELDAPPEPQKPVEVSPLPTPQAPTIETPVPTASTVPPARPAAHLDLFEPVSQEPVRMPNLPAEEPVTEAPAPLPAADDLPAISVTPKRALILLGLHLLCSLVTAVGAPTGGPSAFGALTYVLGGWAMLLGWVMGSAAVLKLGVTAGQALNILGVAAIPIVARAFLGMIAAWVPSMAAVRAALAPEILPASLFWARPLDLFEMIAIGLFAFGLRRSPGATTKKTLIAAIIIALAWTLTARGYFRP
jgi:CheY-like chemotaxis protein